MKASSPKKKTPRIVRGVFFVAYLTETLREKGTGNLTKKDRNPEEKRTEHPRKKNWKSSQRKGRENQRERTNSPAKGSFVAGKSYSVLLQKYSVRR